MVIYLSVHSAVFPLTYCTSEPDRYADYCRRVIGYDSPETRDATYLGLSPQTVI